MGAIVALCVIWFLIGVLRFDFCIFNDFLINQELINVPLQDETISSISTVSAGLDEMKSASVTIVGVGKDIGGRLNVFLSQVEKLASYFNHSQVIFAEGDSVDDSAVLLKSWASLNSEQRTILTIDSANQTDTIGQFAGLKMPREGRIAFARNLVLRELRKRPTTDYLINIDMDILGWDMKGVMDSFGRKQSWDGICAHGILLHGIYRDTYALRTLDLNNNHHLCGHDHLLYNISSQQKKTHRVNYQISKKMSLQLMDVNRIRTHQLGESAEGKLLRPIHVDSCFGGLAIYKSASMEGCEYSYRSAAPPHQLDCEHVFFSNCITARNGARILANPNMKLWYGHSSLEHVNLRKEIYNLLFKS